MACAGFGRSPLVALVVSLGLAVGGCGREAAPTPSSYEGVALDGAAPAFELTDHNSQPVKLADLRGQVVVLTFLDARCEHVCPRTAAELRQVHAALGEHAGEVTFVGINVNAAANTVADVRAASETWHLDEVERWHFLTGPAADLQAAWAAYFIGVVPGAYAGAPLDHTSGVYLIDRQGAWRWYVSAPFGGSDLHPELQPLPDILLKHIHALLAPP